MKKMKKKSRKRPGKKTVKKAVKEKPAVKEPAEVTKEPETLTLDIPEETEAPPEEQPEEQKKDSGGMLKTAVIAVVAIAVVLLAVYFLFIQPKHQFVPGASVDEETFKGLFEAAENIYIFMDVRGAPNDIVQRNILQCGVDFAGSSGVAVKNTTYFSIGDEGCVTPQGAASEEYCFSEIQKGFTIYVKEGKKTTLHSNGMIVGVDETYVDGTCGIHKVG